jgi:hypothetical protein
VNKIARFKSKANESGILFGVVSKKRTDASHGAVLRGKTKEPVMTPMPERVRKETSWAWLSLLAILVYLPQPIDAESLGESREHQIKVAYLYNFGKYVEWPPDNKATFTIGVVGADPFGRSLDELARTKELGGRPITIRRILNADDYADCHILFITQNAADALVRDVLEKAGRHPSLIVGEETGFAQSGGIVNFYLENNRVRFEINLRAAHKSGLRISSKLWQLGRIVGETAA